MAAQKKINYQKGIVIAHGKSELYLARHIKSNLHLPIEIYSKNSGENSIQVTSLLNELNNSVFKSQRALLNNYLIEKENGKLKNFFVMPILDLDDCNEEEQRRYKNKNMFKGHWAYEYIEPIWCIPSLDHVMLDIGLIDKLPKDKEKGMVYTNLFPINHKEADIEQIKDLHELFKKSKKTNIEKFAQKCLDTAKKIEEDK